MGWKEKMLLLKQFYEDMFMVPYRSALKREHREEEDMFMLLCFSEILGIPNPVSFYTLELYPVIYEKFHEWHIRMGMEKSPIDGIHCC
ncbi:hypothetical protein L1765_15070 [Microaerobacter geothermalis]|uniref:cory-CC-star protein n=1 Tax=Microaerobacter geothermalis TaxID=674972 RepID=UPI001F1893A2|nr:cory-CC-star protein [Microaerobacter geothermalis]MCF6095277.1 hypothetical protein [Microaerobacter geothermalis]